MLGYETFHLRYWFISLYVDSIEVWVVFNRTKEDALDYK